MGQCDYLCIRITSLDHWYNIHEKSKYDRLGCSLSAGLPRTCPESKVFPPDSKGQTRLQGNGMLVLAQGLLFIPKGGKVQGKR